jgi:pimeloyl-ACP methyl ester carboxylesterase
MVSSRIACNGSEYHVRDSGGDGPAVLLLHGAPDDGTVWRRQVDALAGAGYRVICPDLLGYGESDRPDPVERYRFAVMAEDLLGLLESLGLERVHLVAHDFGASVGWWIAARRPERVASLSALSLGHPNAQLDLTLERLRYLWYLWFNAYPRMPDLYRADGGVVWRKAIESHPDADRVVKQFLEPGRLEVMAKWEKANGLPEILLAAHAGLLPDSVMPAVEVPTLGMWSSEDAFLWEEQVSESHAHVNAEWRYERIDGAGHWFMLERPEETNRHLLGWLEAH